MTDDTAELPAAWQSVLTDHDLESSDGSPPDDAPSGDRRWLELYSTFEARGFLRVLAGLGRDDQLLWLQFTLPVAGGGRDVAEAVRDTCDARMPDDWTITAEDPDWILEGTFVGHTDGESFGSWIAAVLQLGTAVETDGNDVPDWLRSELDEPSDSSGSGTRSDAGDGPATNDGPAADVFETIGGGDDGATGRIDDVAMRHWEVADVDGGVEATLQLDGALPSAGAERLARALVHSLRSRYDIVARPVPVEGDAASRKLRIRANPDRSGLEGSRSLDEVRSDLESFLDRLERFEELGVHLASVLGVAEDSEGPSAAGVQGIEGHKRGRGRRESEEDGRSVDETDGADRREAPSDSRTRGSKSDDRSEARLGDDRRRSSGSEPSSDEQEGDEVVLDLGADEKESAASKETVPESGLEPGNYRDPRLMRDDASTSLVDIVLRHPGYAEEKMGHHLSILLDVDYPDAMDLVEQAPSVIAWSVGRERALDFKRSIEKAGGKVVLVEPDSLTSG